MSIFKKFINKLKDVYTIKPQPIVANKKKKGKK